jgi:flavin-dependent dehydrogenase
METLQSEEQTVDVLIVGAGLAGLTLARQLLLKRPEMRILMLDRRAVVPPLEQKVGEATVQVSGYYYARVLELEEHLLRHHYMKYNLRFYFQPPGGAQRWEEHHQSYIRNLSNIVTYQLDRNVFEAEVLRVNREYPGFRLVTEATQIELELAEEGAAAGEERPHAFRCRTPGGPIAGRARWVADNTGRGRLLAKRKGLMRRSPIRHASSFLWVEGLLDPEKLTDLDAPGIRKRPDRTHLGHTPTFLATNHFCGEGYWFWEIPLHGKTSLGLVFDVERVPWKEVNTADGLIAWVCRNLPMFARDLPQRKVVYHSGLGDFAHDCAQTLSAAGWSMTGEACRFTDPLYSPGGDLISIYNTIVSDAILTTDRGELAEKVRLYESLARAVYEAYVPSFAVSQDLLGDHEAFTLRYVWELTIYFSFFVFPFINDLFVDKTFLPGYLRRFSQLGPINHGVLTYLMGFYNWKKERGMMAPEEPVYFDFYEAWQLREAEKCFYKQGADAREAWRVLDEQIGNLEELARFVGAHVASVVLGEPGVVENAEFVRGIDVRNLVFDPAAMAARWAACGGAAPAEGAASPWRIPPPDMARFRAGEERAPERVPARRAPKKTAAAAAAPKRAAARAAR